MKVKMEFPMPCNEAEQLDFIARELNRTGLWLPDINKVVFRYGLEALVKELKAQPDRLKPELQTGREDGSEP
jgi:hypothetical protein